MQNYFLKEDEILKAAIEAKVLDEHFVLDGQCKSCLGRAELAEAKAQAIQAASDGDSLAGVRVLDKRYAKGDSKIVT